MAFKACRAHVVHVALAVLMMHQVLVSGKHAISVWRSDTLYPRCIQSSFRCMYVMAAADAHQRHSLSAGSCPTRPGYNSLTDMMWVGNGTARALRTSPAGNAEKICSLERNCVAWNDKGFYFLGTIGSYRQQTRTCSYVKISVAKQGKQ
jgi:hypothetical protein